MDPWTIVWCVLAAGIIGGEIYAAVDTKKGNTISETVWKLTRSDHPWISWPSRVVLIALLCWLIPHLGFGLFSP